jgi:Fe-S cluster assembly scaffold protein SufB
MHPKAKESRNYTQCDSLLIGDKCGAHTVPYIEVKNNSSRVEHEATTSKVDDDQLFYCRQRGMDEEEAVALVVNGFCREVLQALPMESPWRRSSHGGAAAGGDLARRVGGLSAGCSDHRRDGACAPNSSCS